jgi:hypothetical protein
MAARDLSSLGLKLCLLKHERAHVIETARESSAGDIGGIESLGVRVVR